MISTCQSGLGVDPNKDWLNSYYQFCNRIAVLHFLQSRGIHARLLFVYFTGDSAAGRECPKDESGWRAALTAQDAHMGLPENHVLTGKIHKLFLPVFANLHAPTTEAMQ